MLLLSIEGDVADLAPVVTVERSDDANRPGGAGEWAVKGGLVCRD